MPRAVALIEVPTSAGAYAGTLERAFAAACDAERCAREMAHSASSREDTP